MFGDAYKQVKDTGKGALVRHSFVKAIPVALGITVFIFLISALLLTYTALPEASIPFITILAAVVSTVLAGTVAARGAKSKGYLVGSVAGIGYALLLYLLSFLFAGGLYFNMYILILLVIGLFGGAFGGILGINISVGKKRY